MTSLDKSKVYYLAGPMSGLPHYNFPTFQRAAKFLREQGFTIISPEEKDREKDPVAYAAALASPDGKPTPETMGKSTWADFLSRDVKLIADEVQGVIFMNGWWQSRGAKLEAFVGLLTGKEFGRVVLAGDYNWGSDHPETGNDVFPTTRESVQATLRSFMP